MKPRDMHIHIEELVLHGFAPGDRARIADGVGRELERLFAERVPRQWERSQSIERVRASSIQLAVAEPAERIGEKIARSIHSAAKEPTR